MAPEILGGGMDDEIGAMLDRALQRRGREGVVDDGECVDLARDRCDRGDIDHPQIGIGRRFEEIPAWYAGVTASATVRGCVKSAIVTFTPKRVRPLVNNAKCVSVEDPVDDHVIAAADQRPQRGRDRAHAGCDRDGRLGALQAGDALLQDGLCRIPGAAVDVAFALAGKQLLGLLDGFEGIGGGQVDRWRQCALGLRRIVADMNGAGGEPGSGIAASGC